MYTILYASDGSKPALNAAQVVRALLADNDDARLVGLYVTETLAVPYDVPSDLAMDREKRIAREVSRQMLQSTNVDADHFTFLHSHGFAPGTIAYFADTKYASLIVLGSHGSNSFEDVMLGHTTFQVLHRSDRPTLLVPREYTSTSYGVRRILLAVDGSPSTHKAIDMTRDLLKRFPEAKATLLYVLQAPDVHMSLTDSETLRQREREWTEVFQDYLMSESFSDVRNRVTFRVEDGRPARTICKVAEEESFDLAIMGSHGLRAFDRFVLGSVSHAVAHRIQIPLLIATDRSSVAEQMEPDPSDPPRWPIL